MTQKKGNTFEVYRYHDKVAINGPDGSTHYVSSEKAKQLEDAIGVICMAINQGWPFSSSAVETQIINLDE